MNVHTYKTQGGKDEICSYLDKLPAKESALGYDIITSLEEDGIAALDNYTIKPFKGKVWEIKFRTFNRIFYVIADGNNIYLLHTCKKQKNKTETLDKNKVIKRTKELEKAISKKFF
jgi:phage-related protein